MLCTGTKMRRRVLSFCSKVLAPILAAASMFLLYRGNPAAWFNMLFLMPRVLVYSLLLFGVHLFWALSFSVLFGCPWAAENTRVHLAQLLRLPFSRHLYL